MNNKLASIIFFFAIHSCQKAEIEKSAKASDQNFLLLSEVDQRLQLEELLARGRQIKQAISQPIMQKSNNVNDAKIVSKQQNKENGAIGAIYFDIRHTEEVDDAQLESKAYQYLEEYAQEFQFSIVNLKLSKMTKTKNNLVILSFVQHLNGILVRDAYVDVVYATQDHRQYRLREIQNKSISLDGFEYVENERLENDVLKNLPIENYSILEQRKLIWPKSIFEEQANRSVTEFQIEDIDTREHFTFTFDNQTLSLVEAFAHKYHANEKAIQAQVLERNYLNMQMLQKFPLGLVQLKVNNINVQTNVDGIFSSSENSERAEIQLASSRFKIIDLEKSQSDAIKFNLNLQGMTLLIPATIEEFRGINTYAAVMKINQFTRQYMRESDSRYLTQLLNVYINEQDSCNAYYDGRIVLFSQGTSNGVTCANMAVINDVIYHEWGHGLDNFTGRTLGIQDGAFSEGIGDIIAAFYLDSPVMASGFVLNSANGIRRLDNTKKYPQDLTGKVHEDGLIIGAAFWEMRANLIKKYGKEHGAHLAGDLFFNHLLITDAYTESYQNVLRLDEDDGNPATRSENFCLINEAFANHGLAAKETNCVDREPDLTMIDKDLTLGIYSSSQQGKVRLMAKANDQALALFMCKGGSQQCMKNQKNDLGFDLVDFENGIAYFIAIDDFNITEHDEVTLIALDGYGEIVAMKAFRFFKK